MMTRHLNLKGYRITMTAEGEQYRYAIYKGIHLVQCGSGTGYLDVTPEEMANTVNRWLRLTSKAPQESEIDRAVREGRTETFTVEAHEDNKP